jgi:acetyltransferase-like isoleucine patch superfamily enzyme
MKKFSMELVHTKPLPGVTTYQVIALRDIPLHKVKKGDYGGYIQYEENLSHHGDCWVDRNALVLGKNSVIEDNALVTDRAVVRGNSRISGDVIVASMAKLEDVSLKGKNVKVTDNAVLNDVYLDGKDILIAGNSYLLSIIVAKRVDGFTMDGNAVLIAKEIISTVITGSNIAIRNHAHLEDVEKIKGNNISFMDNAVVKDGVIIEGNEIEVRDHASIIGKVKVGSKVRLKELASLTHSGKSNPVVQNLSLGNDIHLNTNDY